MPAWHGCSKTVSRTPWILLFILTAKMIRLFIQATSTPCGCAIRVHKYGPYVQLANKDAELKKDAGTGVIKRQFKCINIDPYANAFNMNSEGGEWMSDLTDMKPELHERKWEIDSLCYPIPSRLSLLEDDGDASIFSDEWLTAIAKVLKTFKEQQRKEDPKGPYRFQRKTERALDTMTNDGWGNPVKPVGLIASAFRPSDDATTFQFLVPSNFFAVTSLRKSCRNSEYGQQET